MTEATRAVLEAAKALSLEEQDELLDALCHEEVQSPIQLSDAWMEEIRRRTAAAKSGTEPLYTFEEICEHAEHETVDDG